MNCKPKLNFHFTSRCNMKCRYCFVPQSENLCHRDTLRALERIAESGIFGGINFVGGEPTVSPLLPTLIRLTKRFGLSASIVTNRFLLAKMDGQKLNALLANLDCVGISVDSLDEAPNGSIVRAAGNSVLSRREYESLCLKIKALGCRLKINTVVSRLNVREDFSSFYERVRPDRIKIFQCLKPNVQTKNCYGALLVSAAEFEAFVQRHAKFGAVIENNSDMTSAYYMLGSDCRFWDNATGKKSPSILEVPVEEALKFIKVDERRYQKRYA